MHSTQLIRWEPYEDRGIYSEQPLLERSIVDDALASDISSHTSLEVLDGVIGLLNNQVQERISNQYSTVLPSQDIRHLYMAYTKLSFKLQLPLPPMRFRDWESFDRKFSDAQNDLDRKIIGQHELGWFDEPTRIVRDAIETGWAMELFTSVDASSRVGWPHVVMAMESLKRSYASAQDSNDYSKVAGGAKGVLEKLSDAVWATGAYRAPKGVEDGPQRIKNRLETAIRTEFVGNESSYLIKLMQSSNDFADEVRHRRNPERYEATVAADASLFLANIMWITLTHEASAREVSF